MYQPALVPWKVTWKVEGNLKGGKIWRTILHWWPSTQPAGSRLRWKCPVVVLCERPSLEALQRREIHRPDIGVSWFGLVENHGKMFDSLPNWHLHNLSFLIVGILVMSIWSILIFLNHIQWSFFVLKSCDMAKLSQFHTWKISEPSSRWSWIMVRYISTHFSYWSIYRISWYLCMNNQIPVGSRSTSCHFLGLLALATPFLQVTGMHSGRVLALREVEKWCYEQLIGASQGPLIYLSRRSILNIYIYIHTYTSLKIYIYHVIVAGKGSIWVYRMLRQRLEAIWGKDLEQKVCQGYHQAAIISTNPHQFCFWASPKGMSMPNKPNPFP